MKKRSIEESTDDWTDGDSWELGLKRFQDMDENMDGFVSMTEVKQHWANMTTTDGKISSMSADVMKAVHEGFIQSDTNNDGLMELDELVPGFRSEL